MYRRASDSDLVSSSLLHFVRTAEWTGQGGVGMSEQDSAKDDQLFLYLLGSPDPSHLMMTECHHHRRVTSHSQSSGFPGPGSWWTACLWEGPPLMLVKGKRGRSITIQSICPQESYFFHRVGLKPSLKDSSNLRRSNDHMYTLCFPHNSNIDWQTTIEFNNCDQSMTSDGVVLFFVFSCFFYCSHNNCCLVASTVEYKIQ